uniref:Uncharacterized protein n=1 Tax=Panagrellus redivivus TaxID=6233 RepID=A0A7E4VT75_PANRE
MQALQPVFRIHPCLLLLLLLKVLLPLYLVVTVVVSCGGKKGTSKKSNKSQSAKRRPGQSDQVESDGGSDAPDSMAKTTPTGTPTVNGTTQTEYLMTEINGQPPTCRNQTPPPTPQSVTPQPPSAAGAGTGLPQSYAAKPAPKMLTSITATPAAKTAAAGPPPSTIPTAPMTNAGTVKKAQTAKG